MSRPVNARAPSRKRGHARVELLLDSAARLFREKGFEGATMSEIAASSGTAIGSLYRFFPTKESLAASLVERYGEAFVSGLNRIVGESNHLTGDMLAGALVDHMVGMSRDRAVALALVEREGAPAEERASLREAFYAGVEEALLRQNPSLSPGKAKAMAHMLVPILKTVPQIVVDEGAVSPTLAELRRMLSAYLLS